MNHQFSFKIIAFLIVTTFLMNSCQQKHQSEKIADPSIEVDTVFQVNYTKSAVYTTATNSNVKLQLTNANIAFSDFKQPLETEASIFVNTSKLHQTFLGIGAALTDAAAETFYKLNEDQQKLFMESYYSIDKGIGYSLARTIIHSCDFSSASYTYVEEGDAELKTFNIDHDKQFRLPFTKLAIEAAGGKLTMYASP